MEEKVKYTPMIEQYLNIKKDYKDAIVFFRLGDFYEMFFEDAALASRILEITLTGKDAGTKERVPMCGIPYHAYQIYAETLLNHGYKVAICEQVTNPLDSKGIVERKVVKVLTPGTIIDDFLDKNKANYLASIYEVRNNYTFAYADISTGDSYVTIIEDFKGVIELLKNIDCKEVVLLSNFNKDKVTIIKDLGIIISFYNDININDNIKKNIKNIDSKYFQVIALLLNYATNNLKQSLEHIKPFTYYSLDEYLKLDYYTKRNLELVETLRNGQKVGSVLSFIDKTNTAMGARMLFEWINKPLIDVDKINERLDYVEIFMSDNIKRQELINSLKGVYDLERIISKISCDNTNAKDMVQLKKTLNNIPQIKELLLSYNNPLIDVLANKIDTHNDLFTLLDKAILDNPNISIKEGNIIKDNFNKDLDEIRDISKNSTAYLLEYEAKEKERLQCKTLKVGYNRVFGYYIEISKGQQINAKDIEGYTRKQTLANAERYISSELKALEDTILNAKDKQIKLEYDIFVTLRNYVKEFIISLQVLAKIVASLDCYLSLSIISSESNFVRPTFNNTYTEIYEGRHPVLESILKEKYVSNDALFDNKRVILITGPNMSGKSTYMRMIAVIVILAQMGSFVPAKEANIEICDQIFTRIGASDDLYSGQSTFMVEMSEANYAISNATTNSLIIFDEIGRGTATYDGMALAEAILEYISHKIKCRTLFSTHYHELTALESKISILKNVHVEAIENKNGLAFLHKVNIGPSDKSYGINVASLAGLPKPLINRAKDILNSFEKKDLNISDNLFDFSIEQEEAEDKDHEIIALLKEINADEYTPKDALNLLYKLKEML